MIRGQWDIREWGGGGNKDAERRGGRALDCLRKNQLIFGRGAPQLDANRYEMMRDRVTPSRAMREVGHSDDMNESISLLICVHCITSASGKPVSR